MLFAKNFFLTLCLCQVSANFEKRLTALAMSVGLSRMVILGSHPYSNSPSMDIHQDTAVGIIAFTASGRDGMLLVAPLCIISLFISH
jgi:hypothetical protein